MHADNQEAEKDDFEEKLKEVQDVCSPIISKVYKESGGAPGGGDFGGDDEERRRGKNPPCTLCPTAAANPDLPDLPPPLQDLDGHDEL